MLGSSFGSVSSSLRRTSANDRSDEILMCSTAMVCDAKVACVLAWVISRSKAPEHAAACTAEQGDEITASHCLPKAQDCATVAPNGAITSRICERVLAAIQFCRGIPQPSYQCALALRCPVRSDPDGPRTSPLP